MKLVCPVCLAEAVIRLDLVDGDGMKCDECDAEYTVADVQAVVESWSRVLPWLLTHPERSAAAVGQTEPAEAS